MTEDNMTRMEILDKIRKMSPQKAKDKLIALFIRMQDIRNSKEFPVFRKELECILKGKKRDFEREELEDEWRIPK